MEEEMTQRVSRWVMFVIGGLLALWVFAAILYHKHTPDHTGQCIERVDTLDLFDTIWKPCDSLTQRGWEWMCIGRDSLSRRMR